MRGLRVLRSTAVASCEMAGPGSVVRQFFELMEARDWEAAGRLLSPDAVIEFSATGERFVGPAFLKMNAAYPEGWSIQMVETLAHGDRVAAQVRVVHGEDVFWCAGFYSVGDEVITAGVEHWVTEGADPPPGWREPYTTA